MPDENPQGLVTKPRIAVQRYGKLPLFLAGGALTLVLLVLIWSVETSTEKKDKPVEEQAAAETAPATQKSLVPPEPEQSQGLAKAEPKEEEQPTIPLIKVVPPPQPSQEYVTRKNELEELRRKRNQSLEKALNGDVRVSAAIPRHGTASVPASSQPDQGAPVNGMPRESSRYVPTEADGSEYPAADRDERIEKEGFFDRARTDSQWTLPGRRMPGQPFELKTGSVIPGMIITGVNSDLPGQIVAQIARNVYDTATGQHLLIPQGSKFYGVYDSRVAIGQSRLLAAFNRILFPDGSSVDLGAMPATDMAGLAGFRGDVNNHYLRIFGSAAVMSLITGGMGFGMDSMKGQNTQDSAPTLQDELGTALASQLGQSSMQLLQRNMQIKPELSIEPGYRFNLVVTKDIVFDVPYRDWRYGKRQP